MDNQILIVVCDDKMRLTEVCILIETLKRMSGVKMVRTIERVVRDGLRPDDHESKES